MKYQKIWEKVLNSDEQVKYEFSVGDGFLKFVFLFFIILAIFSGIIALIAFGNDASGFGVFSLFWVGLYLVLGFTMRKYFKISNAYAFTDRRILIHKGWLSTKATSVNYDKVTEVSVIEPFLARLLMKTGDLSIHTGNVTDAIVFHNISTPYEIKKKLDALRNA